MPLNAEKVFVKEGRYRKEIIKDKIFPLVKPWQHGNGGLEGFITVPADSVGTTGKNVRLKCRYEDVIYYTKDNKKVKISPLDSSLQIGQPKPNPQKKHESPRITTLRNKINPLPELPVIPVNSSISLEEQYLGDETEEESIERISESFQILEEMAESCARGIVRGLVVSGPPGVGKSFGVIKTIEGITKSKSRQRFRKKPENINYKVVRGTCSGIGLYQILYKMKSPNSVVIFDDCDSVLYDEDSLNLLKGALDSFDERLLAWNTESKVLTDAGVPREFDFQGSVIFLSNLNFESGRGKIGEHLSAILSRCHYLDLEIGNKRDQLLRIKQVVRDGMLDHYEFDPETHQKIMNFVWDNQDFLREISLRMVIKIADLARSDPNAWHRKAEMTCLRREARLSRLAKERHLHRQSDQLKQNI